MNKELYLACFSFLKKRPPLLKAAVVLQKILELSLYAVYPLFLGHLVFCANPYWIRSAAVCGAGLLLVSVLRICINAKRPYEELGFEPLIKRDKKGRSMPSRHTFCAAVIAVSILGVFPALGGALLIAALLIGFLRVVLGVHYVKDVVVGFVLGALSGLICLV